MHSQDYSRFLFKNAWIKSNTLLTKKILINIDNYIWKISVSQQTIYRTFHHIISLYLL